MGEKGHILHEKEFQIIDVGILPSRKGNITDKHAQLINTTSGRWSRSVATVVSHVYRMYPW